MRGSDIETRNIRIMDRRREDGRGDLREFQIQHWGLVLYAGYSVLHQLCRVTIAWDGVLRKMHCIGKTDG